MTQKQGSKNSQNVYALYIQIYIISIHQFMETYIYNVSILCANFLYI